MMSLEDLHNFPSLKVPQIYSFVLATRNDPFPSRHAETSYNAKRRVFMARISLQTPRRLVIP